MRSREEYKAGLKKVTVREINKRATKAERAVMEAYTNKKSIEMYNRRCGTDKMPDGGVYKGIEDKYGKRVEIAGQNYSVVHKIERDGKEELWGIPVDYKGDDRVVLKRIRPATVEIKKEMLSVKYSKLTREHYKYDCGVLGRIIECGDLEGLKETAEDKQIIKELVRLKMGLPREYREREYEVNLDVMGVDKEGIQYILKSPVSLIQQIVKAGYIDKKSYIETGEGIKDPGYKRLMSKMGYPGVGDVLGSLDEIKELEQRIIELLYVYKDKGIQWRELSMEVMRDSKVPEQVAECVDLMVVLTEQVKQVSLVMGDLVINDILMERISRGYIEERADLLESKGVVQFIERYNQEVYGRKKAKEDSKREREMELESKIRYVVESLDGGEWYSEIIQGISEMYKEKGYITEKQELIVERCYTEVVGEYKELKESEVLEQRFSLSEMPGLIERIYNLQKKGVQEETKQIIEEIIKTREVTSYQLEGLKQEEEGKKVEIKRVKGVTMLKERPDLEERIRELEQGELPGDVRNQINKIRRYGVVSEERVEELESRVKKQK